MASSTSLCCMRGFARYLLMFCCLRAVSLFETAPGSVVSPFQIAPRGPVRSPLATLRLGRPDSASPFCSSSHAPLSLRPSGAALPHLTPYPYSYPSSSSRFWSSALRERKCDLTGRRQNSKCMAVSKSGHKTHRSQGVNLHTKVYWWPEGNTNVRVRVAARTMKTIALKGINRVAKENGVNLNAFRISTKTPALMFSNVSAYHREKSRVAKEQLGVPATSATASSMNATTSTATAAIHGLNDTGVAAMADVLSRLDPALLAKITDAEGGRSSGGSTGLQPSKQRGKGSALGGAAAAEREGDASDEEAATPTPAGPKPTKKKAAAKQKAKASSGNSGGGRSGSGSGAGGNSGNGKKAGASKNNAGAQKNGGGSSGSSSGGKAKSKQK